MLFFNTQNSPRALGQAVNSAYILWQILRYVKNPEENLALTSITILSSASTILAMGSNTSALARVGEFQLNILQMGVTLGAAVSADGSYFDAAVDGLIRLNNLGCCVAGLMQADQMSQTASENTEQTKTEETESVKRVRFAPGS